MSLSRRLPAGYSVGRASIADALHVAGQLRDVDRAEMEALAGRRPVDVLARWITHTSRVLRIHGEPVVVFGIEASVDTARHAMPWFAAVSSLATDDLTNVMWLSRQQVELWQRRWPVLENLCDARNAFHRQWLQWLDFERLERVEHFGAAGLPFDLYCLGPRRVRR
jgi:hypothetical protein